jgi:acetylornithine deacetylase/succinyl-diaminopimelate desuccinylase-like protein
MMFRSFIVLLLGAVFSLPLAAQTLTPGQQRFRALFKEMVETNTSLSSGSCTELAGKIAGHLKEAGYPSNDIHLFAESDHPKEGGIVAVLPGTNRNLKPILLLGHLDVVEAKREDWTRDPFTLIEEGGYFYGRGTADMKSLGAVWVDTMMRLKEEKFENSRTLKVALTCGEETSTAFNGAQWLSTRARDLIDAEFALNESGGGRNDQNGKPLLMVVQAAEKFPQNYTVEVTNPGGHSARPVKKNAIYQLAAALAKVSEYEFPFESSDITRGYFAKMGPQVGGEIGQAMGCVRKELD